MLHIIDCFIIKWRKVSRDVFHDLISVASRDKKHMRPSSTHLNRTANTILSQGIASAFMHRTWTHLGFWWIWTGGKTQKLWWWGYYIYVNDDDHDEGSWWLWIIFFLFLRRWWLMLSYYDNYNFCVWNLITMIPKPMFLTFCFLFKFNVWWCSSNRLEFQLRLILWCLSEVSSSL